MGGSINYFLTSTLDVSLTPLSLYTVTSSLFSPSCNGYEYLKFFLSSADEYTFVKSKKFFSVSFIINSTLVIPSSSDAFITKFAEPSVVTSSFGFVTPFTSCSFVSVLLFLYTNK